MDDKISTPSTKPPARPPPPLPDDLVEQVLIRLPPDDPALLLHAAAVCKDWCRVVSGAGFHRRLREFHRTALMLGVLCNFRDEGGHPNNGKQCTRFVPTSPFRPPVAGHRNWEAVDARHGHVLLNKKSWGYLYSNAFAVWDPIMGEMRELPPIPGDRGPEVFWRAAVLCAGAGGGACDDDHIDCHHGPFQVVAIIATDYWHKQVQAYVYSSEAGAWSVPPSQLRHADELLRLAVPSALVENALYFGFDAGTNLLKFDLATQEMSLIPAPLYLGQRQFVLTTTEGGQLGFATVAGCKLYLWSREACSEGDSGWTQSTVIELEKLLPADALFWSPYVVASVYGMGVFLMVTYDGLYIIDVKASQVKKICEYTRRPGIFPYMSFSPGTSFLVIYIFKSIMVIHEP
ncbi:unnamed protein product [Urochloa decumbens]|uniref:F-box domain-containing protein n=1 Tax=Urochloa decumbens TaxID=240449 RepID=A0ABC9GCN7_9POAL